MKKSYPKRRDPLIHVALRDLCWAFVVGAMFGLSATLTRISHRFSTRMVHYLYRARDTPFREIETQLEQFAVNAWRSHRVASPQCSTRFHPCNNLTIAYLVGFEVRRSFREPHSNPAHKH